MSDEKPPSPKPRTLPAGLDPLYYMRKQGFSFWERMAFGSVFGVLLIMALDYVFLGLQGTGAMFFFAQRAVINFVLWQSNIYVLPAIVAIFVVGFLSRNVLPIITIPVLGSGENDAQTLEVRYRPGTLENDGENVSWREGKYRAVINKRFIIKRGWFFGLLVNQPVERNVNEMERIVTYDSINIEAYRSQTLQHRLKQEVQTRVLGERQRNMEAFNK